MKKRHKILIIFLFVVVLIASGVTYFTQRSEKELAIMQAEVLETLDLSQKEDGIYIGQYAVFPIEVSLEVTIIDHTITHITILKHVNGQGGPAEVIIDDVIAMQSLDVDLIAGSTFSSRMILLAIQDAIKS